MNKAILITAGVLVILIASFLFITRFTNNPGKNKAKISTAPTVAPAIAKRYPDVTTEDEFAYSQKELDQLNAFKSKLPYYSSNLEIAYDSDTGLFFIRKKTGAADEELSKILKENGLEEFFAKRSGLFVITEDPIADAIKQVKEILDQIQNDAVLAERGVPIKGEPISGGSDGSTQKQDIEFVNKILENVKKLEVTRTPAPTNQPQNTPKPTQKPPSSKNSQSKPSTPSSKGSGGGNCKTGGYPFADRNQNLIGRPYQGTHTLGNWQSDNAVDLGTPIGTPVCAIGAGTIGRIKMNDPNPSSRYAGISVYLQLYGVQWWYTHLSSIAPGIATGTQVKSGQIIGYSGAANGVPHLHLSVSGGNPVSFLGL